MKIIFITKKHRVLLSRLKSGSVSWRNSSDCLHNSRGRISFRKTNGYKEWSIDGVTEGYCYCEMKVELYGAKCRHPIWIR